ncbi:glycoside hydrolase superfamily [Xylariomycetidae sp. FL2044]|nr:glycoside hydrolase superfamily [Xylariomycetidae sp. FL2044]
MQISALLSAALLSQVAVASHPGQSWKHQPGRASHHGATKHFVSKNPFTIKPVIESIKRFAHDIFWPKGTVQGEFVNWKTFKANGANLGGWLEKEKSHDPVWWDGLGDAAAATSDEWDLCAALGDQCGPILEDRYASYINTSTIDQLGSVGVNTLRIPTTYAAWVKVPGSQFYTGSQKEHLREITQYAIERYNMHVIVGLHSLPGGVNSLDIGEAFGHDDWFYNETNFDYSITAVKGVLDFIKSSGHVNAFTFAPINEASDNLAGFGSSDGLSDDGADWILTYMEEVFKLVAAVDSRIPVMLQDNFKGASYWAPFFNSTQNLVIDSHVYYFAAAGTYSQWVNPAVCGQAQYIAEETTFPVFVGEWALQVMYNNTFEGRKTLFDTQRWAWQQYVAGGSFWNAVSYATTEVDGEGTQRDYWSYVDLINAGVITTQTNSSYC